jgi:rod shape-determining protein MreC
VSFVLIRRWNNPLAVLDLRQRSGYLFLAVTLGHILLISAQVNSRTGVPVLEAVTFGAFAEIQRTVSNVVGGVRHVWTGYAGLRQVQRQNVELNRELAAARIEVQEQRAVADRSRGLEQLLDMRQRTPLQTVAAEIIGAAATPDFKTLTIDKGSRDGIKTDMAVISPAGVIGRVVVASPRAAKIQLLIDRNAAAGALIERSRAQGVVIGGEDNRLLLDYVNEISDVVAGDVVVTSGIDGIFPKGFVIGRVTSVEKSGGSSYKRIVVQPAADASAVEEVLVVVSATPGRAAGPEGGA